MTPIDSMTVEQRRTIHDVCWQFETDWLDGKAPVIEDYVDQVDAASRDALLAELLAIELELRSSSDGDTSDEPWVTDTQATQGDATLHCLNELQQRFPDDHALVSDAVERFVAERQCSPAMPQDDRYEFLREIDRGGAAVVWRVYDRHLKRDTAVKLLLDSQNNSEMRQRLELEARLCGRLQHPGIVPVHELSRLEDGRPFITMKLVEGQTLDELLQSDPPTAQSTLLDVFYQATVAVAYAHEQGIIHRDLKPANIMVGEFDEVQVMDWGLGKELATNDDIEPRSNSSDDAESGMTLNGSVFGTLAYMSPEQARGEVDRIDKRSDVFALGAILFRILTGEPIYRGVDSELLLNAAATGDLRDAFRRLRRVRGNRKLKSLTRDCLAIQPSDRPSDAGQVAKQLQRFLKPRRTLRIVGISVLLGLVFFVIFETTTVTEITVLERPREVSANVSARLGKTAEVKAAEAAALLEEKKTAAEFAKRRDEEVEIVMREVSQLISARDLIPAERALRDAVAKFPGHRQLTPRLVEVLLQSHKPNDAVKFCREFCTQRLHDFFVRSHLGAKMRDYGRLAEAETLALEQIQMNSGHPLSHWELAQVQFQQGRFAEAVQSINLCAKLKPNAPDWKRDVSLEVERFKRFEDLHDQRHAYLQRDDEELSLEDCSDLAIVFDRTGNIEAAIRFYRVQLSNTIDGGGRVTMRFRMKLLTDFVSRYLNTPDTSDHERRQLFAYGAEQLQAILPGVRYELTGNDQQVERGRTVAVNLCDDPRLSVLHPENLSETFPDDLRDELSTAWQELRAVASKSDLTDDSDD